MIEVGAIFNRKYKVLKLLGEGGMSRVYLAVDQNLNKQWAIKEIAKKSENMNSSVLIRSAIDEANVMKKLDHPSLPRIVDIIEETDAIYVVMDYIDGENLNRLLQREGHMPQEKVIRWAKELCGVLLYLHEQNPPIIYRDMKPANVIICPNGSAKLIDFGIAREYKGWNGTDTIRLGTRGYAAPEQFGGKGQPDVRTDIYSLGAMLYHLLTGKNPGDLSYKIHPIRQWRPELSSGLEHIVIKCMQPNPDARYQSCEELLYDLNNLDKLEENHSKRQKRKVVFSKILSVIVLFFLLAATILVLERRRMDNYYDSNMLQGETAVTVEEKMAHYTNAIAIKPDEIEPYFKLVDILKADFVFSSAEEQVLRRYVDANLVDLQKWDSYGELAFSIGELYWYYYDYGKTENVDNQLTRMTSATRWFEEACIYGEKGDAFFQMAEIYRDIGMLTKDMILNVREAADKKHYEQYLDKTEQLAEILANKEEIKEEEDKAFLDFLQNNLGSIYSFDDSLSQIMGRYVRQEIDVVVTEANRNGLQVDSIQVLLNRNGMVKELEKERDYSVTEKGKMGDWYLYEYRIDKSVFQEEGSYIVNLRSKDMAGNINESSNKAMHVKVIFGIDKTGPNIIPINIASDEQYTAEKKTAVVAVEDNIMLDNVEVYIDEVMCEVISEQDKFIFEIPDGNKRQNITIVAKDVAGNQTSYVIEDVLVTRNGWWERLK